uniref:Uncharacterized protein n=1 Tax=Octopus bimaculoides TaxID=37653 RepID=A0A0L8GZJ5_OCTBM
MPTNTPGQADWDNIVCSIRDNEQAILKLCTLHELCVTNTYMQKNPTLSWRYRYSKHWHQLDLIVTRHYHLRNVYDSILLECQLQQGSFFGLLQH